MVRWGTADGSQPRGHHEEASSQRCYSCNSFPARIQQLLILDTLALRHDCRMGAGPASAAKQNRCPAVCGSVQWVRPARPNVHKCP